MRPATSFMTENGERGLGAHQKKIPHQLPAGRSMLKGTTCTEDGLRAGRGLVDASVTQKVESVLRKTGDSPTGKITKRVQLLPVNRLM
jgi:hypothetical protein